MEKKEGDRKDGDLIKKKERCGDLLLLHTTNNSSSSSSSKKFGSFIMLTETVDDKDFSRKPSIIMLSDSGGTTTEDDRQPPDDDDQMMLKCSSLGFPLADYYEYCVIPKGIVIGSCNGWVCLYACRLKRIFLWNPSTREGKALPKTITFDGEGDCPFHLIAFGFDLETKDFKVMILNALKRDYFRFPASPTNCPCRVQVYSVSSNSWRLLEGIDSLPGDPFSADDITSKPVELVYLNGSCFFLARFFHSKQRRCLHQNDRLIISFDFTKEIFTPIQLPDHHHTQRLYLRSSLGGKMVLITVCRNPPPRGSQPIYHDIFKLPVRANYWDCPDKYEPPRGSFCFENDSCEDYNIWVLEESSSWKKLHSFQTEQQRPGVWSSPSCISEDGNFALLETKYDFDEFRMGEKINLKLYNLVTKKVMKDLVCGTSVMSRAYAYAYEPNPVSMQQPIG